MIGSRAVRCLMLLETSSPSRMTIFKAGAGGPVEATARAGPSASFDGATFIEAMVSRSADLGAGAAGSSSSANTKVGNNNTDIKASAWIRKQRVLWNLKVAVIVNLPRKRS